MGRTLLFSSFLFLALAFGAIPQTAEKPPSERHVIRFDSTLEFESARQRNPLTESFQKNTARSLSGYLTANAFSLGHLEQVELNRFQCALRLADAGLTYGLIAGAAGMVAGAWDEETAWYIAGAAALAGALLGGTVKADDPKFRVQLRWVDNEQEPVGR